MPILAMLTELLPSFDIRFPSATLKGVSEKKSSPITIQLVFITAGRLLLSTGLRMFYPFLPAFARGLGAPVESFASLVSIRGFTGLLSPFFSPLSERYGRRPVLAASMLLLAAAFGLVFFWPSFWPFGVTIAVIALAKVIYDPAMQAYLGDVVPYRHRGKAISVTELSWAGAFLLAVPIIGLTMEKQGWTMPFLWLSLLSVASAVLLWRFIPKADSRSGEVSDLRSTASVIARNPVIWAVCVYNFMLTLANEVLLIVYGSWMESSFELSLVSLGLATSLIGAAEFSGELAIGPIVDWLGKRPVIIVTGILTGIIYLAIPVLSTTLTLSLAALFILFLFFEMTVVGGLPLMTELVPSARGVVMSSVQAAGSLGRGIGALIGFGIWRSGGFGTVGLVAGIITIAAILILYLWVKEANA